MDIVYMNYINKKITVICGHYGSGKTNLALNLAVDLSRQGENVTICDLDIVNPYFRSSDYPELLRRYNINLIAPKYSHSNIDIPALPPEIYSIFNAEGKVIIDAGGDDAGAFTLGRFAPRLNESGDYDMLYVVNGYRALTRDAASAAEILADIQLASRLKASAIVNNSHLDDMTTADTVINSMPFVSEVAELTGLPVRFLTCPDFAYDKAVFENAGINDDIYKISVLVTKPWCSEV